MLSNGIFFKSLPFIHKLISIPRQLFSVSFKAITGLAAAVSYSQGFSPPVKIIPRLDEES
ncbi:MAG: hypothetical protein Kow0037_30560 [Calditrichia bacterium]